MRRMLERYDHAPGSQVLVVEDLVEVADRSGRDVMGLEALDGFHHRSLRDPVLNQRVDLLAMGAAITGARLEAWI